MNQAQWISLVDLLEENRLNKNHSFGSLRACIYNSVVTLTLTLKIANYLDNTCENKI
jgi:hypothetical protein